MWSIITFDNNIRPQSLNSIHKKIIVNIYCMYVIINILFRFILNIKDDKTALN